MEQRECLHQLLPQAPWAPQAPGAPRGPPAGLGLCSHCPPPTGEAVTGTRAVTRATFTQKGRHLPTRTEA